MTHFIYIHYISNNIFYFSAFKRYVFDEKFNNKIKYVALIKSTSRVWINLNYKIM